jgi:tetratricopeptide (TPR) repeat protein
MIVAPPADSQGAPALSTEPSPSAQTGAVGLLERERDVADIDRALSEAVGGEGAILLIEGPPGIGKTSLLAELRRRARARNLTVLTARCGEIETGFRFGVVRQLLDAPVAAARGEARAELFAGAARLAQPVFDVGALGDQAHGDITYPTLHGLYWLVSNLAERAPLLLAVDDVHWADEPSVRFLAHLALRLAGMPVLVALATRSGSESRRPDLRELLLEARDLVLRPRPLRAAAVEYLVTTTLGAEAGTVLADPCREATGGNPFLLAELLGELRREARPAHEIKPDAVRRLGPERIAAALLLRVGQLDNAAPALARAVAVLGEQARLAACALLAGIDLVRARELADELVNLAVLDRGEPLRFVHPIVRTAIHDDIPAARRSDLHTRAARLLAGQGVGPEQVAVHLVATEPVGDQRVVGTLRQAARDALAGGAPDTAAALLRRALAEPPDSETRALVHFELGSAEHQLGGLAARDHLRAAGEAVADPIVRARALITLAVDTQADPARQREQLALYERAARDVLEHDRELGLQLLAVRLGGLLFNPDLPTRFEDEAEVYRGLSADTPGECLLLSFAARKALAGGESVAEVGALAERAAAHPAIYTHPVNFWRLNTTVCLIAAERYDLAEQILIRSLRRTERAGSPFGLSGVAWLRGLVRHARGDLRGAETDGRAALDSLAPNTMVRAASWTTPLLQSLVDSGRLDEAAGVLAEFRLDADLPPILPMIPVALARGRLNAARGRLDAARMDLEDAMQRIAVTRGLSPFGAHDAPLALVAVLHALGDLDAAAALAEQTLRAARSACSPRGIGGALRASGLVRGGKPGLELLAQAVDTLESSPSLLWRAEALVDFGAALRRNGQRVAAGDALREGMDLAHRCGAQPLVDRAADELRAAGARPRRPARTGADALTAGERRVAELAATGISNKQIAQTVRHPAHRGNAPVPRLRQARDHLAGGPGRGARPLTTGPRPPK